MGENDNLNQGTPPAPVPGQPSVKKDGSTSAPVPATYNQEQLEKHTSDALTEQGRKHKVAIDAITFERNDLKVVNDDREELQRQIDNLSSKDPEVNNVSKLLKEANDRMKAATKIEQGNSERVLRADKIERAESIKAIVGEFEGGDAAKLAGLCETFNAFSEDQIRTSAATLWGRKFVAPSVTPINPANPPLIPYSGVTSGGQEDWTKLSPDDKIAKGLKL